MHWTRPWLIGLLVAGLLGALVLSALLAAAEVSGGDAGAGAAVPANPIRVTFVIHFDPLPAPGGEVPRWAYESERDNLAWLVGILDDVERRRGKEFVPRLTLEMAGDHAEWYLEDEAGFDLLRRLHAKGIHSFGTHFHTNYKAGPHRWLPAQFSPDAARRVTTDHVAEVDRLIGRLIGSDDPKAIRRANHTITGHLVDQALAAQLGFDLQTGGRNEAMNLFFDHDVTRPWRPAVGWPLSEDLSSRWLLVPQGPVLGTIGEHAPLPPGVSEEYTRGMRQIWQDLSLPAMRRKLLHLYLEWEHAERTAPREGVWVFGWHEHTNDLFPDGTQARFHRALRGPLAEYVEWLNDHFIGKRTTDGRLIAAYANTDQVQAEFVAWEKAHPGRSSFHYPAARQDWGSYPHRLKHLTWELMYSHHEEEIRAFEDAGVHVHKLVRTDGRNWTIRDGQVACTGKAEVIYLLWSEKGATTVNFSGILLGKARVVGGGSGKETVADTAALAVSDEPLIVRLAGSQSGDAAAPAPDAAGRVPFQFRMNVNYFPDEAEARESIRNLRRHVALFRELEVKASYWFTGLAAAQIHKLDPEFLQLLNEAGMPVAHHGANRPPNPQPIHRVKGENWETDTQAIVDYESHAIDPQTGALDATRAGGLKAMQQLFDGRAHATGRFFQASILYAAKQFGCRAMIGLKDNTGARTNAGWFLGMMGMPDGRSIAPDQLRLAAEGRLDLYRFIEEAAAGLGPGGVQSIAVLLHDTDLLRAPPSMRERLWQAYERIVRWAARHPRFEVVTFEEILGRIADDRTKNVSRSALLKAARVIAATPAAPPETVDLGGDTLSLADAFQALARALGAFGKTGQLPEASQAVDLLGPTEEYRSVLPPVTAAVTLPVVTGEQVVAAATQVCGQMADRVPARVRVGSLELNPAEFLLAMAETVTAIGENGRPAPVSLHAVDVLPPSARANRLADPLTRLQFWTFKPQRRK